jgi:hypothetical protein
MSIETTVPEKYVAIRIGRLRLVKKVDVADLLREVRGDRDGNSAGPGNCQTGSGKPVKRAPEQGVCGAQKVA